MRGEKRPTESVERLANLNAGQHNYLEQTMNAKKAKELRRIARNETPGMPMVDYKPLVQTAAHNGPVPVPGRDYAIHLGHVEMVKDCTRSVYQQMKRAA